MIADSVAFCRASGKRVVYDAEHFFDGYRDDPGYALECLRAAAEAGAENVTLCDTNGSKPSRPGRRGDGATVVAELGGATSRSASTPTTTPSARSPTRWRRLSAGARLVQGTINGYGERCGNANLVSILPALQLKMGYEVVTEEQLASLTQTAHFLDELCNLTPEPEPALRRAQRLRPQGRAARRRGQPPTPAPSSTSIPTLVGNERDDPALGAVGQGDDPQPGRAGRAGARRGGGGARGRAAQGARAPRLPLRGGAGLLRAAAAPRGRGVRAAVRAGELPRHHREARGRPGGDRGDDQGPGRRRALRQGRRGQRAGQRARPRPARGDRRPPPAPRRHRADQLQGADPRRDPRHRGGHPRPARLLRRRAGVGDDRRLREHHRGLLGGAGRLARVRIPAATTAPGRRAAVGATTRIPLARPEIGAREEELVLEVLRSGRLSLGPMQERFERDFAAWLGTDDAVAVSSGTAALHLGVRALGWGAGDEVLTSPFSFVASANCLLYEGARPVFCDVDPRDAQPRPGGRRGGGGGEDGRDPAGPHLRLPGGDAGAGGARRPPTASASSRTPARRSARSTPRAAGSAPAATSPPSPSTPTSR